MMRRLLVLLGTLTTYTGELAGQTPYAVAGLGIGRQSHRFPIQTNPPTDSYAVSSTTNVLAAGGLGVRVSDHFGIDLSLRSTVEFGLPFRAISVGPTIRWAQHPRVSVRGGLGRIQGSEAVVCVNSTSSCPAYRSEWLSGFEVSVGLEFRQAAKWSLGPAIWWAQSIGGKTQYRSLGLGAQIRLL